ncbi:undecaprenyl/decaprenyl-phosphate alpha-N-acetylglucosaminyl 1-phosphate transferase [Alphaproteobacteria bacterium]|nr:undecaprenyl/decaprenyl-phosphate alpha-N-acetylglucosaminyl 1-phosphate transferase [Alphaproteobacteria bacterium]
MIQFISQNFYALIAGSMFTAVLILLLRPLALEASFVDKPNSRKIHHGQIPIIGGISIFLASILTSFIFFETFSTYLIALFVCAGTMVTLGVIDDKINITVYSKLFFQTAITLIFIITTKSIVTNLGTPFGLSASLELGLFSIPFTLLAIIGLTNAINMIDGCDGLASSLVIISLLAMSIFGDTVLSESMRLLLLILFCNLIVFLFFNFSNSKNIKTFLGDNGSLFLGFIVATSFVEFAGSNKLYEPSIVLWFSAIPIFDFCAVIIRRKFLKRSITTADKSHIHHLVLSWGLSSHFNITALISSLAVALLIFGVLVTSNYPSFSFWSFLALFLLYFSIRMVFGKAD